MIKLKQLIDTVDRHHRLITSIIDMLGYSPHASYELARLAGQGSGDPYEERIAEDRRAIIALACYLGLAPWKLLQRGEARGWNDNGLQEDHATTIPRLEVIEEKLGISRTPDEENE